MSPARRSRREAADGDGPPFGEKTIEVVLRPGRSGGPSLGVLALSVALVPSRRRLSGLPRRGCNLDPVRWLLSSGHKQRVLVAGGVNSTAEILLLSCSDPSDCGQWTLIAPLSKDFFITIPRWVEQPHFRHRLVSCLHHAFTFQRTCYYIYFGFLGSTGSVNELTSIPTGQVTVRAILTIRLPYPVNGFLIYSVFFLQMAPAELVAWRPLEELRNGSIYAFVLRRKWTVFIYHASLLCLPELYIKKYFVLLIWF